MTYRFLSIFWMLSLSLFYGFSTNVFASGTIVPKNNLNLKYTYSLSPDRSFSFNNDEFIDYSYSQKIHASYGFSLASFKSQFSIDAGYKYQIRESKQLGDSYETSGLKDTAFRFKLGALEYHDYSSSSGLLIAVGFGMVLPNSYNKADPDTPLGREGLGSNVDRGDEAFMLSSGATFYKDSFYLSLSLETKRQTERLWNVLSYGLEIGYYNTLFGYASIRRDFALEQISYPFLQEDYFYQVDSLLLGFNLLKKSMVHLSASGDSQNGQVLEYQVGISHSFR